MTEEFCMENREKLGSRLGFILLSAGCAIGLGNVWRFPYITGQNGGGFFVLIYILFLILMGIPIMTMEYSVGRASRKSILPAYRMLEPEGSRWHIMGFFAVAGNYCLLMFYSVVSGWILNFAVKMILGRFEGAGREEIAASFSGMIQKPMEMAFYMMLVMGITFLICSIGLQSGVEKITKVMMSLLILIMVLIAIWSMTLPGAQEGLRFYLKPDLGNLKKAGVGNVFYSALTQSFFTLSLGMGGMEIFGSYIDKKKSLLGESFIVAGLDTFVAFTAGLIIFPACFAYGVQPDSGPGLIFITLPLVFGSISHGRIFGILFFIFLFFAALSTMVGVFENIVSFHVDILKADRKRAAVLNGILLTVLSLPCVLGFNLWSGIQPLRAGNNIMDLEDFFVSNLVLPFGSFVMTAFCTWKWGWGFENYMQEVNTGDGWKVPEGLKIYFKFILPVLTLFIAVYGVVTYFCA